MKWEVSMSERGDVRLEGSEEEEEMEKWGELGVDEMNPRSV